MSSAVQAIDASEFPIKSVTVFKSNKAEVVRTFTLQLEVRLISPKAWGGYTHFDGT